MKRLMMAVGLLCSATLLLADTLNAQRGKMSDATGATVNLFSRGVVRAFGAPPAPPPVLQVTPAILGALCTERADALLTYATLEATAANQAERTALALLRGGSAGEQAASSMRAQLMQSGAAAGDVDKLLQTAKGLLAPDQPQVVPVAAATAAYNELIANAPPELLQQPPAALAALRAALGRLTAASNHAYATERVYPGLETLGIQYANGAEWLLLGQPIQIGGATYSQYGTSIPLGERRFEHVTDFQGVWVLAEEPATESPAVVYVPLRKSCDVELMPYGVEEKVIKRLSLRFW